jgi:ketosteroid isomerase-like protein
MDHYSRSRLDAFNSHNIEGVMASFHENLVMVDATGTRFEGCEGVRHHYETGSR